MLPVSFGSVYMFLKHASVFYNGPLYLPVLVFLYQLLAINLGLLSM